MKKNLIKLLIFILILILPISSVNAASNNYSYKNAYYDISKYEGHEKFNITSTKSHTASDGKFWIHQAYQGNTYIHAYCLNVGQYANTDLCRKLERKDLTADNVKLGSDEGKKIKLLKQVLSAAKYLSGDLCPSSSGCLYTTDKNKVIATQIIVWEIVEGARTTFDKIAPDKYNKSDSAYQKFIKPSSGLTTAYKEVIEAVQKNTTSSTKNTAFDNSPTYTLSWNGSQYTKSFDNIGKYTKCSSGNENVTASVKNNTLTVSTTKSISGSVTITCKYTVGNSSTSADYYRFKKEDNSCNGGITYQDLIRASQQYTYSANFKVNTTSKKVRITKYDDKIEPSKMMTGATFRLSLNGNINDTANSYTFDLTKNPYVDLEVKKSGVYLLQEITVPNGKQKIPDTNVTINIETGKAIISGGSGLVTTNSSGDYIYIDVVNKSKFFQINKINQNGQAVKGATFQIKQGNTPVKFTWNGERYVYDVNGTTNLVNASLSSYLVSGLPDGDYSLVEIAVPYPYVLASSENERTTKFRIKNGDMYTYSTSSKSYSTSSSAIISVKNYTTRVVIHKIGNDGINLPGIKFYLLDSTKTKKIKSTGSNGNYNHDPNQNAGVEEYITASNGEIVINSLPAGTYYLQEFDTGDTGYPVPEGEDALTKVEIEVLSTGVRVNKSTSGQITISNALNQFNFYKIDEDGNFLTGGSFKIQKYNTKTGQYNDIAIEKVASDDKNKDVYRINPKGDKFSFSINNGVVTFKEVESSTRYRIVELEAPDGFIKSNIEEENELIIEVNSKGYVKSNTTLVNKKVDIKEGAQASAELIVNISTGQDRIHYILIISTLLLIITGLIIISRKIRKK